LVPLHLPLHIVYYILHKLQQIDYYWIDREDKSR